MTLYSYMAHKVNLFNDFFRCISCRTIRKVSKHRRERGRTCVRLAIPKYEFYYLYLGIKSLRHSLMKKYLKSLYK